MKVALVYDWADTNYGGAEKVLTAIKEIYPQAELWTSFVDKQAEWTRQFDKIHVSFVQKLPSWLKRRKQLLTVLLPYVFEQFDLSGYDVIMSVSSFAAKGVITGSEQVHICYLLTPTRFLWSHKDDYVSGWQRWWLRPLVKYLRAWDMIAAWRADYMVAISELVARRAEEFYQRKVDAVLYPTIVQLPVRQTKNQIGERFFLVVGRLRRYKKIEQAIAACGQAGVKLRVVGAGHERHRLERWCRQQKWQQVILEQNVSGKRLKMYYNKALALLAPGLEDFGINLLEANAAGTLVVTHPESGARELLTDQMAIDIDQSKPEDSLRWLVTSLWQEGKQVVPRQKRDKVAFQRQWRKLVEKYYDQAKKR